jgi:nucleotide-binding universal stress UspA family protein
MLFRQILVPVDYSEPSLAALQLARGFAEHFGAMLDIVHVWDRPTYISDSVLVGHGQSQRPLGELIKENAERDMREFLAKAALPAGISRRERLIHGDPASALLKEIEQGSSELVVVGTHGRTGLSHLLLGSVAEKLVRHSPVPVLTVPLDRKSRSA